MQNNKQPGFKGWMRDKGYYIVLVLCVAAVGISGYLYFTKSAAPSDEAQAAVSQPSGDEAPVSTTEEDIAGAAAMDGTTQNGTANDSASGTQTAKPDAATTAAPLQVSAPVPGQIIQTFAADHLSYNATTQDWRVHDGVDLAATQGDPVYAAADGTVSAVLEDDFLGTIVVLEHEGGYSTRYCNLSQEVPVNVGDKVTAGATIGTVGNTAILELEEEPHLHFEVYKGEETVNPETFLSNS